MEESNDPATSATRPAQLKGKTRNKLLVLLTILIVVLVVIVVVIAHRGGGVGQPATTQAGQITIADDGFTPATIRIVKGQRVLWLNNGNQPHQVVADVAASGFSSDDALAAGESYSFTFGTAGTFAYHDQRNPALKGTVIVQP